MLLYKRKTFAHEHENMCVSTNTHTPTAEECKLLLWVKMNFRWLQPEVHNFSWFAKVFATFFFISPSQFDVESPFWLFKLAICLALLTWQRHLLANFELLRLELARGKTTNTTIWFVYTKDRAIEGREKTICRAGRGQKAATGDQKA